VSSDEALAAFQAAFLFVALRKNISGPLPPRDAYERARRGAAAALRELRAERDQSQPDSEVDDDKEKAA
jgi:hypothetical protein